MKSLNFEILRPNWPELAGLGGFAESYAHADPASALVKLRLFAENLTKDIYRDLRLPKPEQPTFVDLLKNDAFIAITPKVVLDKLHALRIHGNKAAHGEPVHSQSALWLLREAHDLARWLCVQYGRASAEELGTFSQPQTPDQTDERDRRRILEKLAAQEAQMDALLSELEETRSKAIAAEKEAADLKAIAQSGQKSADELNFSEWETRTRLIDSLLASAGWDVSAGLKSSAQVGKEIELDNQPTTSGIGYADYVLWDENGNPLAVIEAKKTAVDADRGRHQARLYADSLEKKFGHRPVIFYTNGFDIWIWDDAQGYPPRRLFGFYSRDSLQHLANFQRLQKKPLDSIQINEDIVNRLYQLEAIKRVAERFSQKHRRALIVQATGTGKTRVAIALTDLLIRAGWVKRVLFLCDRKELRKQAKNAFNDFLSEPTRILTSSVRSNASERVFLATYPAVQKVFQSFDPGFFDLIIADESHRSIYNVYGDIFHYFDCHQIGLTATPVDFVTRSTFKLFGCEGQLPTSNYDLEQAVEERYLTPFEVYEHTTQFLREGITLDGLSSAQIEELEAQGEDPAQYDFSSEQIDKVIYNKDTNRAILRNLMENGITDTTGQVLGKSIIFARNHEHAMLLRQLFDEMYPQYAGKFCQVIDNYDPRAEQLIDDFKGEGTNNDLTIAISVDMLDTGIDIPAIVNLVFARPIKSPVKFWQMIGRGTRLCPDLFGPGKDKRVFRIFDHWGNFARFEMGYKPAEPAQGKPLAQLLFEERLTLAETALQKSEPAVFDAIIALVSQDINALPEESISVREKWKEKRALSKPDVLKAFAPATVARLRQEIAPLMQWRNIRGLGDALALDLLIARMQLAVLRGSGALADLKIDLMDRLAALQMHLNPVREKAEAIKRVKANTFWSGVSVADLELARLELREIMHHRAKGGSQGVPPKIIDVTEDAGQVQYARRSASLKSVDMRAYHQIVESELKKHFDSNPVLRKIRAGHTVSDKEIDALVSLILTQNPDVRREHLEEFFSELAGPLYLAIRMIVGMDPEAVREKFTAFVQSHPKLSAKQTRFLSLLQNHIARYGTIEVERLYDDPFTVINADGPDGVFEQESDLIDLIEIVRSFGPKAEKRVEENPNERN
ncbi:DEAD/DEAH box helicase family protein [Acidomonas methanolica]|uniref:Type III restriction enzyme res subunit n=1 Tax=Acidomonas methanolica NBRC 104435 TaxID=1231351 RepID=A0A023D868_ACIMT|nr:DEAD/DEAH box helicase family protein [Acidomonas methanolica]TCS23512.1 type I restriction enzyme R subunit [Acidomonas methanolica]GAJ30318.1 type III restriction enzyme res subunit [Acidomonas methanolica NBRC 104435]GBQ52215.1 type I restriction-modification system R subunit [Acidomonas methanolica]GEK98181.1 restriction endonuclease subunit R [Acidomonas methanolica NBRC 104435]